MGEAAPGRPSGLPFLPHYGKVAWSNSRRELSFGDYYPARPNTIFGKALKITSAATAEQRYQNA
jgi:hypothetical protein